MILDANCGQACLDGERVLLDMRLPFMGVFEKAPSARSEVLLGVLGKRDDWQNNVRDK